MNVIDRVDCCRKSANLCGLRDSLRPLAQAGPALVIALALACWLSPSVAQADWKAGTARVNITPPELMWMSGYGSRNHPAEGKLTDLWAKALLLEDDGGGQVLLITLDLVGIDRDLSQAVCKGITAKTGLPRERIALCCSHTHSGPVVGHNLQTMYFLDAAEQTRVAQYTDRLREQLIDLAAQALAARQPCRVQCGNGHCTVAVNRRNNPEPQVPQLRAAGKLVGPHDHDVPVLVVRDLKDDAPRAIVCGYACHATVLDGYQWCGDYPAYFQTAIEEKYPGATAMFWAGCGADQNPLPRRQVDLAATYGKRLAQAVMETLESPLVPVTGSIQAKYAEINLPFAPLPSREDWQKEAGSDNKFFANRAKRMLAELDAGREIPHRYPYPVETWRLGDAVTWVFLGGEVVVDYALRIKRELDDHEKFGSVWVAGYANDVMAYIPSARVLKEGGYEGAGAMVYYGLPASWSPEVEPMIISEVHAEVAK